MRYIAALTVFILLTGCAEVPIASPQPQAINTSAATTAPTITSANTPTSTPTRTIVPSPTPEAAVEQEVMQRAAKFLEWGKNANSLKKFYALEDQLVLEPAEFDIYPDATPKLMKKLGMIETSSLSIFLNAPHKYLGFRYIGIVNEIEIADWQAAYAGSYEYQDTDGQTKTITLMGVEIGGLPVVIPFRSSLGEYPSNKNYPQLAEHIQEGFCENPPKRIDKEGEHITAPDGSGSLHWYYKDAFKRLDSKYIGEIVRFGTHMPTIEQLGKVGDSTYAQEMGKPDAKGQTIGNAASINRQLYNATIELYLNNYQAKVAVSYSDIQNLLPFAITPGNIGHENIDPKSIPLLNLNFDTCTDAVPASQSFIPPGN